MEKERRSVKKLIWILGGISVVLGSVIYVLYKNSQSNKEEVVDIFKEENEDKEIEENNKKEENSKVVVDIKGMVTNPGVYEVDSTMRVNDVILLAGGLIEGADTSLINLAKIVTDEMTIIIYSNEEVQEKYKEEICVCDCPLIENDACVDNKEEDHLININTCTLDELMEINGIGKTKAEAILEYRESNGDFNSIDDIKKVDGIGDALFEKIKAYIKV